MRCGGERRRLTNEKQGKLNEGEQEMRRHGECK
jgi:hypothetical protein